MAARAKKRAKAKRGPIAQSAPTVAANAELAWPFSLIGAVMLCVGAGVLLYPLFLSLEDLRNIGDAATNGPVAAVAFIVGGFALLIFAQNRRGTTQPVFALDALDLSFADKLIDLVSLRFFWNTWKEIDAEAERERAARKAAGQTGYDWRPIVAFATGAMFLALMEYLGHKENPPNAVTSYHELVVEMSRDQPATNFWVILRESPLFKLAGMGWWALWRVLGFFLLPALVVKLVFRGRLTDYGLATAGFLRHTWIYLIMFVVVLILVGVVSYNEHFQTYYPFYRTAEGGPGGADRSWWEFWTWELLYASQFFSLEFFFRGFWLNAAKRSMGSHAIYAMVVPYCMIHFGKPFLETLGAIIAGIALGTLALRTRSIWSGFLIHVSIAISMDLAAMAQTSGLPDRWWPPL